MIRKIQAIKKQKRPIFGIQGIPGVEKKQPSITCAIPIRKEL